MAAPQKKAASVNSSRGTNDRNLDKGEVGGSSPPRPTIFFNGNRVLPQDVKPQIGKVPASTYLGGFPVLHRLVDCSFFAFFGCPKRHPETSGSRSTLTDMREVAE